MRGLPLMLVLLAAVAAPGPLVAQEQEEDEAPETLRLSFFMCDFSRLDEAVEEFEARAIPVWKELVAEDMVDDHGYFVHAWGDEWNLGIYTIGESIADVIAASEEAGSRLDAMYGEDQGVFGEICPHHRDGFYVFGASAAGEDEDDEDEDEEGGGGS